MMNIAGAAENKPADQHVDQNRSIGRGPPDSDSAQDTAPVCRVFPADVARYLKGPINLLQDPDRPPAHSGLGGPVEHFRPAIRALEQVQHSCRQTLEKKPFTGGGSGPAKQQACHPAVPHHAQRSRSKICDGGPLWGVLGHNRRGTFAPTACLSIVRENS